MKSITLGKHRETGARVELPVSAFATHVHMPGATGKGKSSAIFLMLKQLLLDWRNPHCHVVVDFLGGLSNDLLLWMSTDRCSAQVRDRLVLFRPGDSPATLTLNPLLYSDYDQGFYKVNRATELILRAWSAQDLAEQPRLARWLFNVMWACALLKLTIADTVHLLLPGSPYHSSLLAALPDRLRMEWQEILNARGGEAAKILDSTRNRMKPFHESGILRRLFGSSVNRLDATRFMREGKILILDLSPLGKVSPHEANAIAGLVVNEFLAAARSLPRTVRYPTYLWLDEFQRLVTPDFEYAIPEMRQLGVRLVLAHQSFSQLKTDTTDLTSLIWQPQTRLAFGEQGEDAEILANELASLTFDPKWIKDEIHSLRQIQTGHKLVELSSWSTGMTTSDQWQKSYQFTHGTNEAESKRDGTAEKTKAKGTSGSDAEGRSDGGGSSRSATESRAQHLVAELENVRELSSRSYFTFEDQKQLWAQKVRLLRTGQCVLRTVNDDAIQSVVIDDPKPGMLGFDPAVIEKRFPEVIERREQLIEENYRREWFADPQAIEFEMEQRIERVLNPPIVLSSPDSNAPRVGKPTSQSPFTE